MLKPAARSLAVTNLKQRGLLIAADIKQVRAAIGKFASGDGFCQ
jgi:hypothetical protein